ncbi:MAG: type II toxin-antitoxin system HicA family toxin [Singulisphaera sp.]|nr:type II toxin-antitoxin system HicA family toxin [Singulisphaera sp.]
MRRRLLERHLREHGCFSYHHGSNHDIWINPENHAQAPIPRHREVKRGTARDICRQLGVPELPIH